MASLQNVMAADGTKNLPTAGLGRLGSKGYIEADFSQASIVFEPLPRFPTTSLIMLLKFLRCSLYLRA
jgi:hypothetical protein